MRQGDGSWGCMLAPVSEGAVSFLLLLATNMHRIGVHGSTPKG